MIPQSFIPTNLSYIKKQINLSLVYGDKKNTQILLLLYLAKLLNVLETLHTST